MCLSVSARACGSWRTAVCAPGRGEGHRGEGEGPWELHDHSEGLQGEAGEQMKGSHAHKAGPWETPEKGGSPRLRTLPPPLPPLVEQGCGWSWR